MGNPLSQHPTAAGTIIGSVFLEPQDLRLAALWRHDSAKAALPREIRAALIRDASACLLESEGAA